MLTEKTCIDILAAQDYIHHIRLYKSYSQFKRLKLHIQIYISRFDIFTTTF